MLALITDRVIFTSVDSKVEMRPEVLRASHNSEMEIKIFRANMLGFKVPFSNVEVRFDIEEGNSLIELINESSEGLVKVRSKGIEGEAVLGVYSLKTGLQVKRILIKILPRDVADYQVF